MTLFVGPGLKSRQQKALKLLEIMDPSIRQHLGTKQIATGDYTWKDDMRSGLQCAITSRLDKWVTETIHPPYSYDPASESDMQLWNVRRKVAMLWSKSEQAIDYATHMYKVYSEIFSTLIKDQGNMAVHVCARVVCSV